LRQSSITRFKRISLRSFATPTHAAARFERFSDGVNAVDVVHTNSLQPPRDQRPWLDFLETDLRDSRAKKTKRAGRPESVTRPLSWKNIGSLTPMLSALAEPMKLRGLEDRIETAAETHVTARQKTCKKLVSVYLVCRLPARKSCSNRPSAPPPRPRWRLRLHQKNSDNGHRLHRRKAVRPAA